MIKNGKITGKIMDPGVLETMKEKALQEVKQKYLAMQQRNYEFMESIRVNAERQGVNVKTSHAEILTPEMYRDPYGGDVR